MQAFKKNLPLLFLLSIFVVVFAFLFYKTKTISTLNASKDDIRVGAQISENYFEYSDENLQEASKKGKTVLFFATNWCSTCTELDEELMLESERLDPGITVLRLDFDREKEMNVKYKVLVQHTLVQVDGQGDEITKWVGGDLEDINKNLK